MFLLLTLNMYSLSSYFVLKCHGGWHYTGKLHYNIYESCNNWYLLFGTNKRYSLILHTQSSVFSLMAAFFSSIFSRRRSLDLGHPFSMYAEFSEKITYFPPWYEYFESDLWFHITAKWPWTKICSYPSPTHIWRYWSQTDHTLASPWSISTAK